MSKNEKKTLTASDWEQAALELVAEKGVTALAIEPLAKRMGVTKGSFYWHFGSRDELLERALRRWEEHDRRNLNRSLGEIDDPRERLVSFFRRVGKERLTHEVYNELCSASGHRQVEPVLEREFEQESAAIAAGLDSMFDLWSIDEEED